MRNNGFTLIEVLIVIGIIGVLGSIATLQFKHYMNKANVEKQTKELYVDLMTARTEAMTKQGNKRMVIGPAFYSFTSVGGVWSKSYTKNAKYALQWAGGGSTKTINFDERGMNNVDTSICVNHSAAAEAVYNSIVVFATRTQMGKLNQGATACASADIVIK